MTVPKLYPSSVNISYLSKSIRWCKSNIMFIALKSLKALKPGEKKPPGSQSRLTVIRMGGWWIFNSGAPPGIPGIPGILKLRGFIHLPSDMWHEQTHCGVPVSWARRNGRCSRTSNHFWCSTKLILGLTKMFQIKKSKSANLNHLQNKSPIKVAEYLLKSP